MCILSQVGLFRPLWSASIAVTGGIGLAHNVFPIGNILNMNVAEFSGNADSASLGIYAEQRNVCQFAKGKEMNTTLNQVSGGGCGEESHCSC